MKAIYTRDGIYRAVQGSNGRYWLQRIILPVDKVERPSNKVDPWTNLGDPFYSEKDVLKELNSHQPVEGTR